MQRYPMLFTQHLQRAPPGVTEQAVHVGKRADPGWRMALVLAVIRQQPVSPALLPEGARQLGLIGLEFIELAIGIDPGDAADGHIGTKLVEKLQGLVAHQILITVT